MTNHEATEQAYKKGYEDGKKDAVTIQSADSEPEIVLDRIVFTPECKWVYQLRFKLDGRDLVISKELPEAAVIDLNMASSQPSGISGQFKWIPVTERLPERWQNVIAVSRYGKMCVDYVFTDGNWWSDRDVTHWMPLPEPPEEVPK